MNERPTLERFYGRRKGRPLNQHRDRLMADLLPQVQINLTDKLDKLFDLSLDELWLEIGFGAGEHLATQAERNPHIGLIGCEPFVNGVANLLNAIEANNLNNIRIYPDDVRNLLKVLPDNSISRCFVLFPDPWPKKRHHKRQLVNSETIAEIQRILKPGGDLRLASDDRNYIQSMLEILQPNPNFSLPPQSTWNTPPDDWVETRYEKRAKGLGSDCTYISAKYS